MPNTKRGERREGREEDEGKWKRNVLNVPTTTSRLMHLTHFEVRFLLFLVPDFVFKAVRRRRGSKRRRRSRSRRRRRKSRVDRLTQNTCNVLWQTLWNRLSQFGRVGRVGESTKRGSFLASTITSRSGKNENCHTNSFSNTFGPLRNFRFYLDSFFPYFGTWKRRTWGPGGWGGEGFIFWRRYCNCLWYILLTFHTVILFS